MGNGRGSHPVGHTPLRSWLCLVLLVTALVTITGVQPARAAAANPPGGDSGGLYDQFIVKYRSGSRQRSDGAALQAVLDGKAANFSRKGRKVGLLRQRRMAIGADVIRSSVKLDRISAESLMREIADDADVEYVEPDYLMQIDLSPNDPRYHQQWGFFESAGINIERAWDVTTGAGTVVAVIDTGITSHPDLDPNVLQGYDFISSADTARDGDGRDGNPRDEGDLTVGGTSSSWHGTHVAGTVAAVANNGLWGAGAAPNAKVLPIRALGKGGGRTSDIADAIVWAAGGRVAGVPDNSYPAEVINMSLGGIIHVPCSATYADAISTAMSLGSTVVASAGNSNSEPSAPANCPGVISVAAIDKGGRRWDETQNGYPGVGSNYGASVTLAAPGAGIFSTENSGSTTPGDATFGVKYGTSMAAPHVSGVIALVQACADRHRSPTEVKRIVAGTAKPFPVQPDHPIGSGIVDAAAAVGGANDRRIYAGEMLNPAILHLLLGNH